MAGLSFDNYQRNEHLIASGASQWAGSAARSGQQKPPNATSTGTTIVGVKFAGGVVIAADTRSTQGPIVADKNCAKLHRISPRIWCAGAGTAADTEAVTQLIGSNIELHALYTSREPRVVSALQMLKQHLFRYQGYLGAYLIVAGVDPTGAHLFSVQAHGSTDVGYYQSLGSGSLAAMAVLESRWKPEMSRDDAVALAAEAIQAGIWNDLGSGSNVDVCVMEVGKDAEYLRNYITPNVREPKQRSYKFARGTTAILKESIINVCDIEEEQVQLAA